MQFYSPLRYPGGKNKLARFIASICVGNHINGHYVEPYAGGSSVALYLLLEGYVNEITINDFDRSIYAIWYSILNHTEKLCRLIEDSEVTVENWKIQKKVQERKSTASLLSLGFSTLFLNRTNRSGIIGAGIIGGYSQQGKYTIDCRFNKKQLVEKIRLIASKRKSIHVYNLDAIKLIKKVKREYKNRNTIIYFDPPYFLKGQSLYMNSYKPEDHEKVSFEILKIKNSRWIVSYDDVPEINQLYKQKGVRRISYSFAHVAYLPREGKEVLFFSEGLKLPNFKNSKIAWA